MNSKFFSTEIEIESPAITSPFGHRPKTPGSCILTDDFLMGILPSPEPCDSHDIPLDGTDTPNKMSFNGNTMMDAPSNLMIN